MGTTRFFKSYVNLATTEAKLSRIMAEFQPITFLEYLSSAWSGLVTGSREYKEVGSR